MGIAARMLLISLPLVLLAVTSTVAMANSARRKRRGLWLDCPHRLARRRQFSVAPPKFESAEQFEAYMDGLETYLKLLAGRGLASD
uniref:Neuropeptide F n=1 Tax=Macrostomum lignano TaxID=282301 RepID=A0A1I8JRU3_9PLAT